MAETLSGFEVGGSFEFDDSLMRDLKRIEKTLESEREIKEFQSLSDLMRNSIGVY